jgi:hypothetical protein
MTSMRTILFSRWLAAGVAVPLLAVLGMPARASTIGADIPDATASIGAEIGLSGGSIYSAENDGPPVQNVDLRNQGEASGIVVGAPVPGLRAAVDTAPNYAAVGLGLTYYFEVVGSPDISVPIVLTGLLSISTSAVAVGDMAKASASVTVLGQYHGISLGWGGAATDQLNLDVASVIQSDTIYRIDLYASVREVGLSAAATAFIDPSIAIDPAFLAANPDLTIAESPGIGNTPPAGVPEPASLWLAAAGLLGLGGAAASGRRSLPIAPVR